MNSPGGREPWARRAVAWGGAALFVASLAYFLFTYAFTYGENQYPATVGPAVAWNLTVFTVFALHHSVFARERVRAVVARNVPASLERSVYVWIASLLFMAVCALWRPVRGVAWSIAPPLGWLAYGIMAVGVWLSVRSAAVIDVWELAGVRQVRTSHSQPLRSSNSQPSPIAEVGSWSRSTVGSWEFKTTGPYGFVRHPIYLGWFLMVFGVPVMTGTRLVFAVISCAYLLIAIPLEERTLRRSTAGKYDDYMRLVRWKLVPGIY